MKAIQNRYEFIVLFDVENGNPNGDPDAANMPRIDPETNYGFVTDVCLKRKIRNYVEIVMEGVPGYNILIKKDRSLNSKFADAHKAVVGDKKNKDKNDELAAQKYICENYYDVRAFGAVMNTGDEKCGTVRGPVQLAFARSVDPINAYDVMITRQAITKTEEENKQAAIGRKSIVPYGLYRVEGYVSALLAQKVTGFSEEDLELLWTAIVNMFEHDHSAARGKMGVRKLIVFKHDSVLGNAPSETLFDKITVAKKENVDVPRSFKDYEVSIDKEMPSGVTLIEKI